MSGQANQANATPSGAAPAPVPIRPKVEKVPMALSATSKPSKVALTTAGLKGKVVVILITDGDYSRQFTVSAPIGHHWLGDVEWVGTPSDEVPSFLHAADDPSEKMKTEAKQKLLFDFGVEHGYYLYNAATKKKVYIDAHGSQVDFQKVADERQKAYDEAKNVAHQEYLADCARNNRKAKADWKFNEALSKFTPEWVKLRERDLAEKAKGNLAFQNKVLLLEGEPFITRGGQSTSAYQRPMKIGSDAKTSGRLVDELYASISQYVAPVGSGPPAAYGVAKDDRASRVSLIQQQAGSATTKKGG